jgi:capsular polysaccharide biosynthesis protein
LIKRNKEILEKVVKQLDNTITKEEIVSILKGIKPESKTSIITNPINISPIVT